jgi:hypothetical protein
MQPEAGVVGPHLAIAFILGTAIFRSLSERSGQVPASTLTNSVANDPKRTSAFATSLWEVLTRPTVNGVEKNGRAKGYQTLPYSRGGYPGGKTVMLPGLRALRSAIDPGLNQFSGQFLTARRGFAA